MKILVRIKYSINGDKSFIDKTGSYTVDKSESIFMYDDIIFFHHVSRLNVRKAGYFICLPEMDNVVNK